MGQVERGEVREGVEMQADCIFPKAMRCLFSWSTSSGKQRGGPLHASSETKKIG